MEEKKLTDEEVLTAIELCFKARLECCKCPYFNKNGRNFCIEDNSFYKDMKRIVQEKAELQKQVDEWEGRLVDEFEKFKVFALSKAKEQAVKDTAKDLLIDFNEWINEHYDVKYDTYCVCIPVDKVSEFLMHKANEYGVEVE